MRNYLLIFFICFAQIVNAQWNIKLNEKAPIINVTDWIINTPKDKNLNDKFIVLEFWATWCGPCIEAVPHLNEIQDKVKATNLYYISITDESQELVNRIAKRIQFNSIVVSDQSKKTQIAYGNGVDGLEAYPMTILIDNKGIIKWIGLPNQLTTNLVEDLLANRIKPFNNFIKDSNDKNSIDKTIETDYKDDYFKMAIDRNIKYVFDLKKSIGNKHNYTAMDQNIFRCVGFSLSEIYNKILNINPKYIKINNDLKGLKYDIMYKNNNHLALQIFENKLLDTLQLSKKIVPKIFPINKVDISNPKLLEKALGNNSASISYAGDKIIFANQTIKHVLSEINKVSEQVFEVGNIPNVEKFDFVIGIKSKDDIIKSLNSYGLRIKTINEQKDTYLITKK